MRTNAAIELEHVLLCGPQQPIHLVLKDLHLAPIPGMLNIEIVLLRHQTHPLDPYETMLVLLPVSTIGNEGNTHGLQESFSEDVPGKGIDKSLLCLLVNRPPCCE
jgi:hypothetical protein